MMVVASGSALAGAGKAMATHEVAGGSDVTLAPASPTDAAVSSMTFDKIFHGGLEATSVGQMLAVRNPANGSAGCVAMERVTGTLAGLSGTMEIVVHGGRHEYKLRYDIGRP